DASAASQPRVVATIVAGRVVHLAQADIIVGARGGGASPRTIKAPMDEPRYAIYFLPPADSALYRLRAGFLGYDCYTGESLRHPQDIGLTASECAELTREPRKYGFHATLKAPFRLLPPFTEADLTAELERFSAIPRTLPSIRPTIQSLARFLAVVPEAPSIALDRLAADSVMAFDRFRRPLMSNERERRLDVGPEPPPNRKFRSVGVPLRLRRLSLSSHLDGCDRHWPSGRDPGVVGGSFRLPRRRTSAFGHASRTGAAECAVDAVSGVDRGRADRGAVGSVEAYLRSAPGPI